MLDGGLVAPGSAGLEDPGSRSRDGPCVVPCAEERADQPRDGVLMGGMTMTRMRHWVSPGRRASGSVTGSWARCAAGSFSPSTVTWFSKSVYWPFAPALHSTLKCYSRYCLAKDSDRPPCSPPQRRSNSTAAAQPRRRLYAGTPSSWPAASRLADCLDAPRKRPWPREAAHQNRTCIRTWILRSFLGGQGYR